jgi:hypothetical protein
MEFILSFQGICERRSIHEVIAVKLKVRRRIRVICVLLLRRRFHLNYIPRMQRESGQSQHRMQPLKMPVCCDKS